MQRRERALRIGAHDRRVHEIDVKVQHVKLVRALRHPSIEAIPFYQEELVLVTEPDHPLAIDGEVRIVAAYHEDSAALLLRAALARIAEASVLWLTANQQWAIRVCVEAGLELRTDQGAVFIDGDVGPFHPYIPNGAFL